MEKAWLCSVHCEFQIEFPQVQKENNNPVGFPVCVFPLSPQSLVSDHAPMLPCPHVPMSPPPLSVKPWRCEGCPSLQSVQCWSDPETHVQVNLQKLQVIPNVQVVQKPMSKWSWRRNNIYIIIILIVIIMIMIMTICQNLMLILYYFTYYYYCCCY